MTIRCFAAAWIVCGILVGQSVAAEPADKESPAKEPTAKQPEAKESGGDKQPTAPATAAKPAKKSGKPLSEEEYYQLFRSFADTLDQVERNYVKEVDRRELMEAAIKGVLGKLDPYSSYIGPSELGGFKNSVESQFGGIGIQITIEEGQLRVLSPLVGTPAYRAGIQAGDRILEIEGEATKGIDIEEAVKRLKGEAGTSVNITVYHPLTNKTEKVSLKREVIHVSTVLGDTHKRNDDWEFMLDADKRIGYIRLTAFSRDTTSELKKALEELSDRKLKGLILDLRFNPGGLLTAAIDISDMFIPDGRIVSTKGRNTPERTWEAKKEGTFEGFPMVVLVNRYSASASEIVSACLQDHKRAIVIGERTWGKGSVQNVIELEDGKSALKLTTASYQRPNGHNIHRFPDSKESDEWGVRPNDGYDMRLSDSELSQLVQHRRKRDILIAKEKDSPGSTSNDATKSDDATPENKSPGDEKKSDDKSDSNSSEDKPDDSSDDKTTDGKKDPIKKADEKKDDDQKSASKQVDARTPPLFVDRQLQRAVEYLTSEIARAP